MPDRQHNKHMVSELFYTGEEQNSVAAKLIDLFTLPSKAFMITVPAENGSTEISVKIRLLNDKENQEVANIVDKYGNLAKILAQRKQILARAVESIEGTAIEMPAKLRQAYTESLGREPTPIEEKLWVFEACQSPILNELINCYDELQKEQRSRIEELKKKSAESLTDSLPEMK